MTDALLPHNTKTMPPKAEVRQCWLSIRAAAKSGDIAAQALVIALSSGHPIALNLPEAPEVSLCSPS